MRVPRSVFGLHAITDLETSRYSLGGVRFTATETGPMAEASDGACVMRLRWSGPSDPLTVIVPAETCRTAERVKLDTKAIKKNPALDALEVSQTSLSASDGVSSQTMNFKPLEDRWFNFQAEETTEHSINVNPNRLIQILNCLAKHCGDSVTIGLGDGTLTVSASKNDRSGFAFLAPIKS